ncbi:hypothetical protein KP509_07G000400 [Ceratopteris richardii]|nr:hypothetical protein KP509_07G000400 [Ceratopteris richardii]
MQSDGISPDSCTYSCVLKACGSIGDLHRGQLLHSELVKEHLCKYTMVANSLIDMYAKCGHLGKSQWVFDELVARDIVSWTALIAGYAQHGRGEEAIIYFDQMQAGGFFPNSVTFACVLKACGSIGALIKGQEVHGQIVRAQILEKYTLVANALIDMYVKCGALEKAQEVFEGLSVQNVIACTALISGYTQNGYSERALDFYEYMQLKGLLPNAVTYACLLKACGSTEALEKGVEIHYQIEREGLLKKDILVANALIDMYAKCDALEEAQRIFDNLQVQNVVSWTTLIAGYAEHGHGEKAWSCFEVMQLKGLPPNEVTFACILKACSNSGDLDKGLEIHAQIVRAHWLEEHIMVANALIDMYAKCGAVEKAQKLFDELSIPNVISWNGLIAGYVQQGHCEEALSCFKQMQAKSFSPNLVTFASVLKALGSIGALDRGQELHAAIVREYAVETDIVAANALLDMYIKCGALDIAKYTFDQLLIRDLVSWNTLVTGYVQHEHGEAALSSYERMQAEGLSPDIVTIACALKACSCLGASCKGKRIHSVIEAHVSKEEESVISIGLLILYASCGLIIEAHKFFDKLQIRDVAGWSALMEGYAQLGNHEMVLSLFEKMLTEGIAPDMVTFTIVLNACSHAGLLDKGQMYFEFISKMYGIIPTLDHHNCLVDLLSRAGHLKKASLIIEEMPMPVDLPTWHTLLGACHKWIDLDFGRWAFQNATQFYGMDAGTYVSIHNIYSAAIKQQDLESMGHNAKSNV